MSLSYNDLWYILTNIACKDAYQDLAYLSFKQPIAMELSVHNEICEQILDFLEGLIALNKVIKTRL